jgi:hypothetical protein
MNAGWHLADLGLSVYVRFAPIVLQNPQMSCDQFPAKGTKRAAIADRCGFQPVAGVACKVSAG